jgi:hypothetical protein
MKDEELLERAIELLMEHLGPVETSRFLALPSKKRIESVRRHRLWQASLDKDAFFDTVFSPRDSA